MIRAGIASLLGGADGRRPVRDRPGQWKSSAQIYRLKLRNSQPGAGKSEGLDHGTGRIYGEKVAAA
jgi:hypothetical protein